MSDDEKKIPFELNPARQAPESDQEYFESLAEEVEVTGKRVGALIERLYNLGFDARHSILDGNWVSIGNVYLKIGFMCLARAVSKPPDASISPQRLKRDVDTSSSRN